ncbi:transporter [Leucobacter sp. OAMLP11]|uniref:MMPL family transporter n=1 Tax=unclassified Leucobacter TaxID=2621730 RepID=UPI000C19E9AD|nr:MULTISPECIES: MMPL family transporter [unclassified Leucobacter]PIO51361.1 transporter [Leucobacter sp. OAMLP11]
MSSMLYALGRFAARARTLMLLLWIAVLAVLGTGAAVFGQGANAPITIPGTESQQALDSLARTFPQVSGTSAQIIVVAKDGQRVDEQPYRGEIERAAKALEGVDDVNAVQTPFGQVAAGLAKDGSAALITVQLKGTASEVPKATLDEVKHASDALAKELPSGAKASYGGEVFNMSVPGISPTEAIGVVVAFVVLILTLGSLLAAGMPLLIAILGVGVAMAGIIFTTAFVPLTSTTPMLALMLGLAVGIDYTLFIVSRHQEQLRAGVDVRESIARATATSGSAVVFAGLTVIIALVGLSVAGIPFLTALGVAAAAAVAIAVLISVTLTPAILSMAGERILPRKQRKQRAALAAGPLAAQGAGTAHGPADAGAGTDARGVAPAVPKTRAERFFGGWVRLATKKPIITIVAVLLAVGAAAIPALDLRLALPDATALPADDPARVTSELTSEHFGAGATGPLILTGSIVASNDPVGLMNDLADEVRSVPGVAEVPLATPNATADTGIIQVVPEAGPHAESTAKLVDALRAKHDAWEQKYGVSLAVTGFTAVAIDVSNLLAQALLPFAVLVVGLSLILLAMVFRSVWVPIKATLGYLLSVGAAFGAVVAVFQWGWFADLLHVPTTGPVLSFMPIILMGVLFGLAMDYEVFLVSRIREEVVHGADAQSAIRTGFVGSARVVTAAAIIMFAVFAAFVPEGDASIKVIALGLAVGVFVDAFLVRMTLVPAVLALLGDRAWRMPRWLSRVLPVFDVEGEGLARELAHENWPPDQPDARIAGDELLLRGGARVASLRVGPGEALRIDPKQPGGIALAEALSGRSRIVAGTLRVTGLLLPERAGSLRRRAAWATPATVREATGDRPELLVLDLRGGATEAGAREIRSALTAAGVEAAGSATVVVIADAALAAAALPAGTTLREARAGVVEADDAERADSPETAALIGGDR